MSEVRILSSAFLSYFLLSVTIDEIYLSEAVKLAQAGLKAQEEPVGAVVVVDRRVVGRAHHQTRSLRDPTAHAAMIALTQAAEEISEAGKLKGALLYSTESPCRMCLAAAELTGVRRIIYGAAGKARRLRKIKMVGRVLARECTALRQKKH